MVFDLPASLAVDLVADMLSKLYKSLAGHAIALRLPNVDHPACDSLRRDGQEERFGSLGPAQTISAVAARWRAEHAASVTAGDFAPIARASGRSAGRRERRSGMGHP